VRKRLWGFGMAVASAGPYTNNTLLQTTTSTSHHSIRVRVRQDALSDDQPKMSKN